MIDDKLIQKIASKYLLAEDDVNWSLTKEEYDRCMQDPDCYSKYREDALKRWKKYHARQQENPSEAWSERRKQFQNARTDMRNSGSLEGLASVFALKIQTVKSELIKKIKARIEKNNLIPESDRTPENLKKEIENFPAYKEFMQDSKDLYYLRDKMKEYSPVLDGSLLEGAEKELGPTQIKMGKKLQELSHSMIRLYGDKYKSLVPVIEKVLSKLSFLD